MEEKEKTEEQNTPYTGPAHGPQGVDKAPGEEPPEDELQFKEISQKGKKVDGDPEKEEDQPASQQELPDGTSS